MSARAKAIRKALLAAAAVFVLVGIVAPFVNAARFQKQIHEGLERGLHRKVEIAGKIRFLLFTGPGFTVDDVLIGEDPRAGIEPFAHVSSLSARLRLRSLWTGKLEFSNLKLDEPSVNLVKAEGGSWNIQPLLQQAVGSSAALPAETPLPDIQVRGGRLNFKFGDTKSVFYLANADVDITALNERADAFSVAFEGEPARTDRAAQSFGKVSGRGRWTPAKSHESEIDIAVRWEKSPIAEFVMLWSGHDAGVHGLIAGEARLSGPVSNIAVSGSAQVEDIHRWDLMPAKAGGWPLSFRGALNVRDETVMLETVPVRDRPVDARFRAAKLLSKPEFGVVLTAHDLALAPLLEIARHMGAPAPAGLSVSGAATGALGYSQSAGLQGRFVASGAVAQSTSAEPLRCDRAEIVIDRNSVRLLPSQISLAQGQTAQIEVEAEYPAAASRMELHLSTHGLKAGAQSALGRLLSGAGAPLLEYLTSGRWKGALKYRREGERPGIWSGNLELQDVQATVPGFAGSVAIQSAAVALNGSRIVLEHIRGTAGKIAFQGQYRYEPGVARPHRFSLDAEDAAIADLEDLLLPTLRRRQGLLARTLRFASAPPPDWLKERRAEGTLHIGALHAAMRDGLAFDFEDVRTSVLWDGVKIELPDVRAGVEDGSFAAAMTIDVSKGAPLYRIQANVEDAGWRDGRVDADGKITAAGTGVEFLASLKAAGCFASRSVTLAEEAEFKTFSGCYDFAGGKPAHLQLSKIQAKGGQETYAGRGGLQADGRLSLEFSGGKKPLRLTGTLAPWQLEVAH
jgi:hypothetical protein